jgi:hypothetical protein
METTVSPGRSAHRDAQLDSGVHPRPDSQYSARFRFRFALWLAVRNLRDRGRWNAVCGHAEYYRRVIEGYRKTLAAILLEKGKPALNKYVEFFGIAIAECDELLGLCARLRLLHVARGQSVLQRVESITTERGSSTRRWDTFDLNRRNLHATKKGHGRK